MEVSFWGRNLIHFHENDTARRPRDNELEFIEQLPFGYGKPRLIAL